MENFAWPHEPFKSLIYTYGAYKLIQLKSQGGCSHTYYLIPADTAAPIRVLQARDARFALDIEICSNAKRIYAEQAPSTRYVEETRDGGLLYYDLELLPGIPYSRATSRTSQLSENQQLRQQKLLRDMASFLARGWHAASGQESPAGKVGTQIHSKLSKLSLNLPSARLREAAASALDQYDKLSALPVVLTHGDLVPSNIIVQEDTGRLSGLVDWAEAEYLPFGMALYGIEYLLGFSSDVTKRRDSMQAAPSFKYYDCATELRRLFWSALADDIPMLKHDSEVMQAVKVARRIGILLWFGFAWDNGAIDRVVLYDRDPDIIELLETFLEADTTADATFAIQENCPQASLLATT